MKLKKGDLDAHYKSMHFQPMEVALRNNLDPVQQSITKYVWRYKDKGGVRDLKAALGLLKQYVHFVEHDEWLHQDQL